ALSSTTFPYTTLFRSVIVHKENKGFPYSCNHGAMRSGRSTYIVFMNSDIVTTPGWLEAMKGVFEKDPKVGVVGAKLIFPPVQLRSEEHTSELQSRENL